MVRTQGWLLVAVTAFGLGAVACKKDDKTEGTTTDKTAEKSDKKADDKKADDKKVEAKTDDKKVEVKTDDKKADPGKAEAAPPANPNADDLSLLPVDSEAVIGINYKQLASSALWKEFVA